jgi:DNA-binding protein YbaB
MLEDLVLAAARDAFAKAGGAAPGALVQALGRLEPAGLF